MPSTYTSNLGIELPADGEQDGVWGDVVNDNMSIIDRAINGSITLSLSGTASTLTTTDGTLSDGQYKLLALGGTPSGTHTITIAPNDAQKIYFVTNGTAQSVVFTQGSGGNVTIAAGDSGIIYSNGGGSVAAVLNLTNDFAMNSVKITGGSITGITDLAIADGGTGASDAGTARTNLGLGTMATQAASSVAITGGSISGITDLAIADGGTGASTAANARTNLGLAIGTNVQAYDADLAAIAGLAVTDNNFIVGNGTTWVVESGATARTSLGLGSIATQNAASVAITGGSITGITDLAIADGGTGASDAATARTNLGLAIGTNVQAYDADLAAIAALAVTDGNFIVGNGTAWVAESGSTARTSLGLGTIATQNSNSVSITGGSIAGITDLAVADGGTGASDASTARTNLGLAIGTNVLAFDSNLQSFVNVFTLPTADGTNGQFLTTNGTGTLQFTTASSTSPQADAVNVTTSTAASAFKVPFANTTASTTGYYQLLQDSTATFTYNPSSDTLTVGTVAGNATSATTLTGLTSTVAELNFVDGVTSNVQTQLNSKQATITGAATTITSSNLTASRALASDASGKVAVSSVTSTELGYLSGITGITPRTSSTGSAIIATGTTAQRDGSPAAGYFRFNSTLGKFEGYTGSAWGSVGGGATGGGSDEVFFENGQTVTTNYTITNGKNAMSAGPITINSGVTVTVGTGEVWTIV